MLNRVDARRRERSGRVAWQFVQDIASELGKPIA
jgi:predicted AAA+ superfamily ATPase